MVMSKIEFLKRNGLCFVSFEKQHISSNCNMNHSCKKCHRKHSSLCLQKCENRETKANENSDKKNGANGPDLSTENCFNSCC